MEKQSLRSLMLDQLPFEASKEQLEVIRALEVFCLKPDASHLFMLKGYAGTGKTSIIGALVKSLPHFGKTAALLAPTGRAAKVITSYSGRKAFTIHKKIYQTSSSKDGKLNFRLRKNNASHTIFIVDEASMIHDGLDFDGRSLLEDLLLFVNSGNKCGIILVGDTAQLPPVGIEISPALDPEFLEYRFHINVFSFEMTQVHRQAAFSGILHNATMIRNHLESGATTIPKFDLSGYEDIIRVQESYELEDALNESYDAVDVEGTMVVCRSNKRANAYNQQIRFKIRWKEEEISAGDYLMVVKNNYFWLQPNSKPGFIANGDIIEVMRINTIHDELYGFRFAEMTVRLVDYPDEPELETIVILDTLQLDSASLSFAASKQLYEEVAKDYMDVSGYQRLLKIKSNPYFNALQVKFAYAVTCHKAQGGQWENVIVEQSYLADDTVNKEYLRWLYTALTRATSKLYLVGFKDSFFKE